MGLNDDPAYRLETWRNNLQNAEEHDYDPDVAQRWSELSWAMSKEDPEYVYNDLDGKSKEYAPATIWRYIHQMLHWGQLGEIDYLNTSSEELNTFAAQMDKGTHPNCKEGGYARQTTNLYISAIKAFYTYHDDLGIDPENIRMLKKTNDPAYDERDMYTREDINALREAMPDTRWRALLETLIYTGQRIRAIQTLRIRDIETDEKPGHIYLNDEEFGLKGADRNGLKRPLFGARKAVRDWLKYHPLNNDPDAFVFIGDPSNARTKMDQPMSTRNIRRRLKEFGKEAGVSTDVKPHKFRHYFVNVMKEDYELEDWEIKFLLGHAKNSNVMNTTYRHIFAEQTVENIEIKTGYREAEEDRASFTPPVCPVCDSPLDPGDRFCSDCGEEFGPQSESLEDLLFDSAMDADDEQAKEDIETLKDYADINEKQARKLFAQFVRELQQGSLDVEQ